MKILVIVAHSDDQVLGPGGTVAKYAAQGAHIQTIIFSYGELSHPHYKQEAIRKIRQDESDKADVILGTQGVEFLAIPDGAVAKKQKDKTFIKELTARIQQEKPHKIFTHALDEAHPDHIAVHHIVLRAYDALPKQLRNNCSVYSFGIWRFFKFRSRQKPRLVVDISDTFNKKIEALKPFKSQKVAMLALTWSVYIKAVVNGFWYNTTFAEVFYKLR